MAPFFHVLIKTKGEPGRYLFGDLDRAELKRRFLKPYSRGTKIVECNSVVDLGELDAVHIICTERPKQDTLDQLMRESVESTERLNTDSSFNGIFLGFGYGGKDEDIVHAGTDVTAEYIHTGPGTGGWIFRYLTSNWTIALVGGLIVTVVGGIIVVILTAG